ncbi:Carboxy-terminal processing protease CtpB [bacterium HR15]|nr:Carboxy-terminal processing protease CtpB [bacterium HR15]
MKRTLLRGGLSLLVMGLAFTSGWITHRVLYHAYLGRDTARVVQRDFAPTLADARTPHADGKVSEPAMIALYLRVFQLVRDEFVEPVDPTKLAHGSLQMLLGSLNDPHTQYLTPEQRARFVNALNGQVEGIGALLGILTRKQGEREQQLLQVISVLPGSPAERAGLKPGDFIMEVNKKWVISEDPFYEVLELQRNHADRQRIREADRRARERLRNSLTLSEAIELLSRAVPGEEQAAAKPTIVASAPPATRSDQSVPSASPPSNPTSLELTIQRAGQTLQVKVEPTRTQVRPLEYSLLQQRWGYLRFHLLNSAAAKELPAILKTLQQGNMKGLIIDLRGTAIGQQEASLQVLQRLVSKRQVALVEYRDGKNYRKRPLTLGQAPQPLKLPIAVLIDRGTYNLAELTALALRTSAKARLFGMPTAGDASQVALYRLQDGSGFTMTVGRYLGADGTTFHQRGVQPDERVPEEPRMRGQPDGDPALARAIQWLSQEVKA